MEGKAQVIDLAGWRREHGDGHDEEHRRLADAVERLERDEMERALRRAIAELPEERRIVVVLRDLEGLSYEEIAEALGLSLGTVRSRLHRGRMELKGRLEKFFA
jgi:RNA polymerase sigma factor (sigma-70 family)